MSLSKNDLKNSFLNDEKEFIKKEVSFLDRVLPFFKKKLKIKIIIFIGLLILIYKFHKFFVIILSIIFLQYIKFKRTRKGINLEIEPSYLLALAITLVYGLEYGFIFIIIQLFLTFTGFSIGTIVNFFNKLIFITAVYFYWVLTKNHFFLIYFAIFIVILTDIIGFFIRKKLGQNFLEIMQVVLSNSIIRWIYFSFFLDLVVFFIK